MNLDLVLLKWPKKMISTCMNPAVPQLFVPDGCERECTARDFPDTHRQVHVINVQEPFTGGFTDTSVFRHCSLPFTGEHIPSV